MNLGVLQGLVAALEGPPNSGRLDPEGIGCEVGKEEGNDCRNYATQDRTAVVDHSNCLCPGANRCVKNR